MKLKIVLFNIFYFLFSNLMFANLNVVKDLNTLNRNDIYRSISLTYDKVLIKNNLDSGKYKNARLIKSELVRINEGLYTKMSYDVEVVYSFTNAKIIRSIIYTVYRPILSDEKNLIVADIENYSNNVKIVSENNDVKFESFELIEELDKNKFEGHFLLDIVGENQLSEKENFVKVEETLEYLPYLEFDKEGYAYIKGSKVRFTAENSNNIMITYFPKENISLVEIIDFDNGRYISKQTWGKKGKIKIEDISSGDEEIIKNNGVEIVKLIYKNKKFQSYEILNK